VFNKIKNTTVFFVLWVNKKIIYFVCVFVFKNFSNKIHSIFFIKLGVKKTNFCVMYMRQYLRNLFFSKYLKNLFFCCCFVYIIFILMFLIVLPAILRKHLFFQKNLVFSSILIFIEGKKKNLENTKYIS